MINTFSLKQISQTGNLHSFLKSRQYKFDRMARFMEINSINSKVKQSEVAGELGCSSSTLKR